MRVVSQPLRKPLAIAVSLLLLGIVVPAPVLAQGLSWGEIVKWLSPKRVAGGTRDIYSMCLLNGGEKISVLTPKPTIFWRGGRIKLVGLRKTPKGATPEDLMWKSQPISTGVQALTYDGKALQPGQSYDWVFFTDAEGKTIKTSQTIAIASPSDAAKALGDMSKLPSKGEAKTLDRVKYLIDNNMPTDAIAEVMRFLPSSSAEMKQTAELLKTVPCVEEKKSEK